jgi:hypothetical protein
VTYTPSLARPFREMVCVGAIQICRADLRLTSFCAAALSQRSVVDPDAITFDFPGGLRLFTSWTFIAIKSTSSHAALITARHSGFLAANSASVLL